MIKKLCLTILTMVGLGAYAQTDGILWKVTGNGLSKPSYILGTIHVTCNSDKIMTPLIDSLIGKTDVLATEINFTDEAEIQKIMQNEQEVAHTNLSEILNSQEYTIVDKAVDILLQDTLLKYNNKSLMGIMSSLLTSPSFIGCNQAQVIDILVSIKAYSMGKKMIGLDGFEFQKNLIDSIPQADKKQWLLDFCNDIEKSKQEFKALENAYLNQDAELLKKLSFETNPEFSKYEKVFLTDRNIKWVDYLKANMKQNAYFVAVGAAHLGGTNGVIALLKKAGYKLTPIKIKF